MKKGAFDFIEKPFDDEQLLSQVPGALEGYNAEFASAQAGAALARARASAGARPRARGLSRQIAEELAISLKTVEFHARASCRNSA